MFEKKPLIGKIKNFIIRKDNNKNPLKINQQKEKKIITKVLLYPMCYIVVNIIYIVTYTHNHFIFMMVTVSFYFFNKVLELPLIFDIITLTLVLIGLIFLKNSVYTKKDEFDMLEALLETISTPGIFKKFKYAKRASRAHWRRTQYLRRKDKKKQKETK